MYFQDDNLPFELVRLICEDIMADAKAAHNAGNDTLAKALKNFANRSQNIHAYDNVLALAKRKPDFYVDASKFDADIWALGLPNGVLDLRTGKLRAYTPDDYITKSAGAAFVDGAGCPLFESFLLKAFAENTSMVKYLQRVIGYTLTGDTQAQCLWIHVGHGRNGKSTFMTVLNALLGDYATTANASTVMHKPAGSASNDVARLKGARLVNINELEDGKRLAEAEIKNMVGGDLLVARGLFKEYIQFYPQFKLHLTSNYTPSVADAGLGFWRRINLIRWNVIVAENDIDTQLAHKLKGELSGILNWALAGLQDYLAHGLQTPQSVLNDTQEYQLESDVLAQFIEACCVTDKTFKEKSAALYDAFSKFCDASGRVPYNTTRFGKALAVKGFESYKSSGLMAYKGLALKH